MAAITAACALTTIKLRCKRATPVQPVARSSRLTATLINNHWRIDASIYMQVCRNDDDDNDDDDDDDNDTPGAD